MAYPFRTDRIVSYEDWTEWTTPSNVFPEGVGYRRFIQFWAAKAKIAVPDGTQISPITIHAYISEGRWVADCPAGCGGALMVTPNDRWYFCVNCGSGWHRVLFPTAKRAIETILLKRPLEGGIPKTRNWRVGESVAQLRAENLAHGVV